MVALTHGVVKEREVPTKEIDKAIRAKVNRLERRPFHSPARGATS